MSMLTRCPNCSTSFRITTDQLVSRQGKVRCGHCQNVFSALGSLVHTREPVAHPPSGPIEPIDAPSPLGPLTGAGPITGGDLLAPTAATAEQAAFDAAIQKEADARKAAAVARNGTPSGTGADDTAPGEADAPPRRKRRIAWLSLVGVLAAGTLLSAQAAYFYRDQLAVLQPETKPWLLQMCVKLKCKVETPVDPQAINIESSGLEVDPAEKTQLQLSALLRNRAAMSQNLPYLEVTLLDAQEAPLARRVFRPDEYAPATGQLAANGEYQVKLAIDASQLKANGYRLYAFYP
jgi:predicted Zn finger-like uncharacterized protein